MISEAYAKERRILFTINSVFLIVMGGVFFTADLLGYKFGIGPLGKILFENLDAIGYTEAHGMALIMGFVLLLSARNDGATKWHLFGAAVHLLLGGSNLFFWETAIYWNLVPQEILVTSIHAIFIMTHLTFVMLVSKAGHKNRTMS